MFIKITFTKEHRLLNDLYECISKGITSPIYLYTRLPFLDITLLTKSSLAVVWVLFFLYKNNHILKMQNIQDC